MTPIFTMRYASPCGEMLLASRAGRLCLCDWAKRGESSAPLRRLRSAFRTECVDVAEASRQSGEGTVAGEEASRAVLTSALQQLDEYFDGRRKAFDIPLLHVGTAFQQRVWEALPAVPYGTTVSYGDLSARLGRREAVRAVAGAVGANAISIFVPCHRIVGADGTLTGYAGGIEVKRFLLALEGASLVTKKRKLTYTNS